ncbi:HTH DNA binding protein [Vibrio phage USC-1]|uniref:HTH cro/C1-type domain-containing protein n=2 Tax=Aphroditevirus USC1 TaxID=2846605 RepID=A0A514A2L1_9CAUD|nr:HTH DNA binding protein [Vibrio phage USC-1]QCW23262.1 hypothetical protein [Vibrio phage 5 TSL-2019]QDH47466.1 hypothetical protein [Vibrio phage USC-1]
MTIKKDGSLNQIRIFALVQLSSWVYRNHKVKSIKAMAEMAKVNPSTLSSIKNGSVRSISLNRIFAIMDNLNINYTFQMVRRRGITSYSFQMDVYNVRKSDTRELEVSYQDEYNQLRSHHQLNEASFSNVFHL